MSHPTLLADPSAIEIDAFVSNDDSITIRVHSTQPSATCPGCRISSDSLKCRYVRQLSDLPWHDVAVRLELHTRKFRCHNELCQQKVFCERLPQVAARYARKTVRLSEAMALLAFNLGGRNGSRTAARLKFPTSKDTLLRIIRRSGKNEPSGEGKKVRILGVDDFAFRKGQTYGTILVDLEARKAIDLLPDREADTLKTWLQAHPEIEVVSRDRAPAYADGTRRGAPQAKQVADQFHLLKNLREALEQFLGRKYALLKQAHTAIKVRRLAEANLPGINSDINKESPPNRDRNSAENILEKNDTDSNAEQTRRAERFNKVRELREKHYSISAIARTLKMHRRTVRLFLSSDELPVRQIGLRRNSLTRFIPFLEKRWAEGCRNATKLQSEIQAQGFQGSGRAVRHFLQSWREPIPEEAKRGFVNVTGISRQPPSARQTGWLLFRPDLCQKDWHREYAEELCRSSQEIEKAKNLTAEFYELMKNGKIEELKEWLDRAAASGINEMASFAKGIRQDLSAVNAAIETQWSNGQTEGQVNRLKTIKRAMYGRANFDLLRAKVLYAN
jgi:transposase